MLGIVAGIIDLIPMIFQHLELNACISAFSQWVVLGVLINYIDFGIRTWIKGLIVAELSIIPILFIVSGEGVATVVPIVCMTAVLGSLVGHFGSIFAQNK